MSDMKENIKRLFELYDISQSEGFTIIEWNEAVVLLKEIIEAKRSMLEKWL